MKAWVLLLACMFIQVMPGKKQSDFRCPLLHKKAHNQQPKSSCTYFDIKVDHLAGLFIKLLELSKEEIKAF